MASLAYHGSGGATVPLYPEISSLEATVGKR